MFWNCPQNDWSHECTIWSWFEGSSLPTNAPWSQNGESCMLDNGPWHYPQKSWTSPENSIFGQPWASQEQWWEQPERCSSYAEKSQTILAADSGLCGLWRGKGFTYEVKSQGGASWACWRWGVEGVSKRFTISYHEGDGVYWWGYDKKYFLNPSEVLEKPDQLRWYGAADKAMCRPSFTWWRDT